MLSQHLQNRRNISSFQKCPRLIFHCQKEQKYANITGHVKSFEEKHGINRVKDAREVQKCECLHPPHPCPSLSQSLHVHNSVSEEDLLLLDVLICMDLKKGRGGFYDTDDWMRPQRRAGKASSVIRRWGWRSGKEENKKSGTVIYNSGNSGWRAAQNDSVQMEWYVEGCMQRTPSHVAE